MPTVSGDTMALAGMLQVCGARQSQTPIPTWDSSIIRAHRTVGTRYHRMTLLAPTVAAIAEAGQFVMVTLGGGSEVVLPRPMAIHRRRPEVGEIDIVYAVTGRGTRFLRQHAVGDSVVVTGPLGRGFDLPPRDRAALLIGRGVGVAAIMTVAEDATRNGVRATAVLSAHHRADIIGADDCAELGIPAMLVADDDGSAQVTQLEQRLCNTFHDDPPAVIMTCGSIRLVHLARQLAARWGATVQVSLEAHMACGLGYCHGCAAPIPTSPDREGPLVCVDGPVFDVVSH